jgi:MoaA/NifB/PqqE/SkfB family radical SAM enzyme
MPLSWILQKLERRLLNFTGTQGYLTIQLDITNACNLRCLHCYHSHHRNEGALELSGWLKILDQYAALTNKLLLQPSVVFCGGEPFLSSHLKPLMAEMERRWPRVPMQILTNGVLVTKNWTDFFKKYNAEFQVSLDGPDSDRHDSIRGAGNFERSRKGITDLKAAGFPVDILAILSKKTSSWIGDFFDLAQCLSVDQMNFTRLIAEGAGAGLVAGGGDSPLAPLELKSAMQDILEHSTRTGVSTATSKPLFHLLNPRLGGHAKFGFQGIIVDYKGNLKVSSRVGYTLGNILEEGLENLFLRHPLMNALRSREIQTCGTCSHFDRCAGDRNAAFAQNGSFLAPDPGCWINQDMSPN